MGVYNTIDPATGEQVAQYQELSDADLDVLIGRSTSAYRSWRTTPLEQRRAVLTRAAELHREQADELAKLLTLEMGKPIAQAKGEVELVASIYQYYADHVAEFLADEPLTIAGPGTAVVRTEPIGPLIGVMPWNYPYYQVARFAAPNIALGNTIILKHARNCPQSALAVERVLSEAGLPDGVYLNAFISSAQVAATIADPRVQGVSVTGSEKAGSAVGEVAGRHMKKVVLELGGSDPFLVLADADVDAAAKAAVVGRFANGGQACTASKRFIVDERVYDEFVAKLIDGIAGCSPTTRRTPKRSWGRWPRTRAPKNCMSLCRKRFRKAPRSLWAVTARRAPTIRRPSWHASRGGCAPTARSCSVRWRSSTASDRLMRLSIWRTTRRSALRRVCSPPTRRRPTGWPRTSRPAWCGSTAPARRRRTCRSAASKARASAASWPGSDSTNSPTRNS